MGALIVLAQQDETVIRAAAGDILSWVVGVLVLAHATQFIGRTILKEWEWNTVKEKIWALLIIAFGVALWGYAISLARSAIQI